MATAGAERTERADAARNRARVLAAADRLFAERAPETVTMEDIARAAGGGTYAPGTPRARYDYQERYLRDFFQGHFGIDDFTAITVELVNARVDPRLAGSREQHERSYRRALAGISPAVAELGRRRRIVVGAGESG